jgi:hypothetical protein
VETIVETTASRINQSVRLHVANADLSAHLLPCRSAAAPLLAGDPVGLGAGKCSGKCGRYGWRAARSLISFDWIQSVPKFSMRFAALHRPACLRADLSVSK